MESVRNDVVIIIRTTRVE